MRRLLGGTRLRLLAAIAGLACALSQVAGAGAVPRAERAGRVSTAAAQRLDVTAWLPYWEMPAALNSTLDNAGLISTASPYWYDIAGDSTVHDEAGAGSPSVVAELAAHHIRLVPMVTEQSGMAAFARILASSARRGTMVRTLVRLAAQRGYSGLDLDFESFAYDPKHRTALAARVASLYPLLVAQTCRALHAIRRSCQVTVMARTGAAHGYVHGDIPDWIYDYAALARAADRVQIMAYDDHSPGGPAGPIAPLGWVRRVIAFARTQGAPSRFELGVPAYGYEWSGRTTATAVYARQVQALATQMHARLRWDSAAGEETLSFRNGGHRETVWLEDAQADAERARLAVAAGFAGVAVWAAGYEQPQLWRLLHGAGG